MKHTATHSWLTKQEELQINATQFHAMFNVREDVR